RALTKASAAQTFPTTALDRAGNPPPDYTGIVHFSSSDNMATLPVDYTFIAQDHGVHSFSLILKTAGGQSLSIADTVNSAVAISQQLGVTPPATSGFDLECLPTAPVINPDPPP